MPRTFTALAAAEVAHYYPFIIAIIFLININIMILCSSSSSCPAKMLLDVQVAGESVLMVVGGDNLADNQESSLEIYNRSGSIKLELKLKI